MLTIPVIGPGAASLHLAAQLGTRISVLTPSGRGYGRVAARLRALALGDAAGLACAASASPSWTSPSRSRARSTRRPTRRAIAVEQDGADVLVLGCMSMAFLPGICEALGERVGVPVVNPVVAALKTAEAVASHAALPQQGRLAAAEAAGDRLRFARRARPPQRERSRDQKSKEIVMSMWRTVSGRRGRSLPSLLLAPPASAAPPGVLVTGDNLPANVDPHQIFDVPMQLYSLNTYDNLYRYQGNPPKLEPWLAQSHTVSADGLTWEFKLRPGAKFHDGSEITADDVVYSFKRVLAIGKAPSGAFKPVLKPDNVTAPDKSTVRFVLDKPYAPFLAAIPIVMVVNPRVVKANESQRRLGRGLAGLERRGLRRLPARCRDLPPARARRPQEERRPFPRLGRQPQGAEP